MDGLGYNSLFCVEQHLVNKSLLSNLAAAAVLAAGYLAENELLKSIGLFALSGALTNWLAIHMLFEKVPGLYGSGVVPSHFEEFKVGIRDLLMKQFISPENMQRFLGSGGGGASINLEPVIEKTDLNPAFDGLVTVIEGSSFGGMLAMVGGVEALQPLREPFVDKMKSSLLKISATEEFQAAVRSSLTSSAGGEAVHDKINAVIEKPRTYFVIENTSPGTPVFNSMGNWLGVVVYKMVSGRPSEIVTLPATDILEIAEQVRTRTQ